MKLDKFEVLKRSLNTEKTAILLQQNKYSFIVTKQSNKKIIKNVIEDLFAVEVEKVNILNEKSTTVYFKGKPGKRSGNKKAIVTLVQGQEIKF